MFKKQNKKDEDKLVYSTTSLLLKVASADQIIKNEEFRYFECAESNWIL